MNKRFSLNQTKEKLFYVKKVQGKEGKKNYPVH